MFQATIIRDIGDLWHIKRLLINSTERKEARTVLNVLGYKNDFYTRIELEKIERVVESDCDTLPVSLVK